MPEQSSPAGFLLGFLVFEPTAKEDGFISAAMVTDNRGYPLEFKATTPVRPSLVQRTLYGATLGKYVAVELCGKSLISQLSRKPIAVLVSDPSLLEMANHVEPNVIAIWRAGEQLKVGEDDAEPSVRGTIKPQQGRIPPLIYEGRFADPGRQSEIIRFLEDCAGRFDLAEVFDRMREALKLLAKEDRRYA